MVSADRPPPETTMPPPSRAFADYSGTLPRASSIAHWQLRDLVCCVPTSSTSSASSVARPATGVNAFDPELFVVRHCSTLRYSLRDRKSSVVQALPFAPTSMTAGHGYVASGGQHGQLDVRRLSDGAVVLRGAAGGSVNNALALTPSSGSGAGFSSSDESGGGGGVTLFVCNNDCSIKAYALPPIPVPGEAAAAAAAPRTGSGNRRRRRGVRGGGRGGGMRTNDENDENENGEMTNLDGEPDNNDCDDDDDDLSEPDGEDEENAAAVADTVAAAFEDHHLDSLAQQQRQREEEEELEQQREQQQRRRRRGRQATTDDVEAGRETLMASLEARVAAAVAAAVGAAAATVNNNNSNDNNDDSNDADNALRPRSAANDANLPLGNASSSALLLRRRRASATTTAGTSSAAPAAPSASARAARLAASSPAAVVRCLDPVNYCAPSPPNARGVPGFSSSNSSGGGGGSGTATISAATLAAVGDCPSLSLHAPTESGYSPLASWDLFDDAGMACAWSASGSFVAAVAQCGSVVCVDPRVGRRSVMRRNVLSASSPPSFSSSPSSSNFSGSVLARWRTPGGGAARALKASPAGSAADLLLVTEHDTFAHLVDARRFDAAQTLEVGFSRGNNGESARGSGGMFGSLDNNNNNLGSSSSSSGPTANGGHHLSGAAFSPEGDLAFVGAEDGGVAVFDVRTAERCCVGEVGYR